MSDPYPFGKNPANFIMLAGLFERSAPLMYLLAGHPNAETRIKGAAIMFDLLDAIRAYNKDEAMRLADEMLAFGSVITNTRNNAPGEPSEN